MAVNVNDKIRKLSPARRRKVETRASELVAEEMTLRELRTARKLTQVRLARTLGITQDSVSVGEAKRHPAVDSPQDGRSHGR